MSTGAIVACATCVFTSATYAAVSIFSRLGSEWYSPIVSARIGADPEPSAIREASAYASRATALMLVALIPLARCLASAIESGVRDSNAERVTILGCIVATFIFAIDTGRLPDRDETYVSRWSSPSLVALAAYGAWYASTTDPAEPMFVACFVSSVASFVRAPRWIIYAIDLAFPRGPDRAAFARVARVAYVVETGLARLELAGLLALFVYDATTPADVGWAPARAFFLAFAFALGDGESPRRLGRYLPFDRAPLPPPAETTTTTRDSLVIDPPRPRLSAASRGASFARLPPRDEPSASNVVDPRELRPPAARGGESRFTRLRRSRRIDEPPTLDERPPALAERTSPSLREVELDSAASIES